jgi:hypothetical protein
MSAPEPLVYTAEQAAARLGAGITANWLRERAAAERIPHTRLGRRRVWTEADLAELLAGSYVDPTSARQRREGAPSRRYGPSGSSRRAAPPARRQRCACPCHRSGQSGCPECRAEHRGGGIT